MQLLIQLDFTAENGLFEDNGSGSQTGGNANIFPLNSLEHRSIALRSDRATLRFIFVCFCASAWGRCYGLCNSKLLRLWTSCSTALAHYRSRWCPLTCQTPDIRHQIMPQWHCLLALPSFSGTDNTQWVTVHPPEGDVMVCGEMYNSKLNGHYKN